MTKPPPPTPADLERLLLGAEVRYTRDDVASATGVSVLDARKYWRALGYPDTGGDVAFTQRDIEALREVHRLVDSGLIDEDSMIQLVRGLGRMASRLAEWHAETVAKIIDDEATAAGYRPGPRGVMPAQDDDRLVMAFELTDQLLPAFERLVVYAWRRKLALAAERLVELGDEGDGSLLSTPMTVGFADLVSFTRLSTGLTARALADLIQTFEAASGDIIFGGGGRVVKTMGDEVLFVAPSPTQAAAIALQLADDIGRNPTMPSIRVGLATGPVVTRHGDVFGHATNLASRLTSLAGRNVVLVDEATVTGLADNPHYSARRLDSTDVRGVGPVEPYELSRRDDGQRPADHDRPIESPT